MSSKKEETSPPLSEKKETKMEKLSTVSYVCVSMTSFTVIYLLGYLIEFIYFNQSFIFVFLLTAAYALYTYHISHTYIHITYIYASHTYVSHTYIRITYIQKIKNKGRI